LVTLSFDKNIYSVDAIKKSAYKLSKIFSIMISVNNEKIICEITFTKNHSKDQQNHYLELFKKEVLDQDLRESISKETEPIRNLILAHAFSNTKLIKNE